MELSRKLVSSGYRTGLSPSGTHVEICRAETGVRKAPNGAPDRAQIPAQRLRPLHLTCRNVEASYTRGDHAAETQLAGWAYEIRTRKSVRNKLHLNWRHNFREIGRNSVAETVRV